MGNLNSVKEYLASNKGQFCDDCLSFLLKIKPRQQINQICNTLMSQSIIHRFKGQCEECKQVKLVNHISTNRLESMEENEDYLSIREMTDRRLSPSEFESTMKKYWETKYNQTFTERALLVGPDKYHKFDLVSDDCTIIIECKSYKWTQGGNFPSAKISHLLEALFYFSRINAQKKVLAIQDDHDSRQGSLVEMFIRRYDGLIDDVEIWTYHHDPSLSLIERVRFVRPAKASWYEKIEK